MYKLGWELELSDFKSGAEFNEDFEQIATVITNRKDFFKKTVEIYKETERRMSIFRKHKKNNIKGYNKSVSLENKMKRRALVVDELACILDETGMSNSELKLIDKIKYYLSEISRKSRAAGIHLILCMQRPDANIIKGQIKNMLAIRISGRFADSVASKIILDNTMASKLPAIQGRMILKNGADITEFQGYYFDMEDYSDELYQHKDPLISNAVNLKKSTDENESNGKFTKEILYENPDKKPDKPLQYPSYNEFLKRKNKDKN